MYDVKLSIAFQDCLSRQTPNSSGTWGEFKFHINKEIDECDFWVVYESLYKREKTKCPKENVILITGEPESYKTYNSRYLDQFAKIITSHKALQTKSKVFNSQQSLPWYIGMSYNKLKSSWDLEKSKTYDDFNCRNEKKKNKLISVITSSKRITQNHIDRVNFVSELKSYFGDVIDVFGNGINTFADKWDVISDYKYHITIENSAYEDYFTEKLADVFLAETYPIYYGCLNVNEYFPEKSYSIINIYDIKKSIKTIEDVIYNNYYENNIENIKISKERILNQYNLFPMLVEFMKANCKVSNKANIELDTEKNLSRNIFKRKLYNCFLPNNIII